LRIEVTDHVRVGVWVKGLEFGVGIVVEVGVRVDLDF